MYEVGIAGVAKRSLPPQDFRFLGWRIAWHFQTSLTRRQHGCLAHRLRRATPFKTVARFAAANKTQAANSDWRVIIRLSDHREIYFNAS